MKMRKLMCLVLLINCACSSKAETYQITFSVTIDSPTSENTIGLRGNVTPLSWEKDYPLSDPDGDGIYEATITFETDKRYVNYKFLENSNWELEGSDNRRVWFKTEPVSVQHTFNEFNYYDDDRIAKLSYTPTQIKEDIAILKKTISYIHPSLYAYRSKIELEKDFQQLEKDMLANPSLPQIYKSISKFTTNIQCSHTFTNPWNQGPDVKHAIFHQPDKIPFTFSRIGKRIFIDKNASANQALKKGLEVISINGQNCENIMTKLTNYITSDGDNYEKRLQRLTLSGNEKFALFDIFYPLEFGSVDTFKLVLKDQITNTTLTANVAAMSKTNRSAILKKSYKDFESNFEDNWQFKIVEDSVGHLKINSFAVYNKGFDWKAFLNDVFKQLGEKNIQYFIIDIRDNEGGDTEVVEYLLERILTESIKIEGPQSVTAYRKIPEGLKPYISTWDKKPYNWGMKVKEMKDGRYKVRPLLSGGDKTYQPVSDGFRGKTYLITGAQNSSATHLMATYVKRYQLATIVGQPTGGNQRGLNGGYYFFHRLPNCRVEIDIPVFNITTEQITDQTPNGGIQPDVKVEKNATDFVNGIDTELETVLDLIHN